MNDCGYAVQLGLHNAKIQNMKCSGCTVHMCGIITVKSPIINVWWFKNKIKKNLKYSKIRNFECWHDTVENSTPGPIQQVAIKTQVHRIQYIKSSSGYV
jgi:hypothetical protein